MHDFFAENTVTGKPLEILVVEVAVSQAKQTLAALEQLPFLHRASLVRDGASAIEFLRQEGVYRRAPRPELLLLDLGSSETPGADVLRAVRSSEELSDLPVIVVTDAAEECGVEPTAGVRHVLRKPVRIDELLDVVREIRKEVHHQERFGALDLAG